MLYKKHLQKILAIVAIQFLLIVPNAFAQKEKQTAKLEWHTDLMKAHELSEKSKKPIFAFFTGSDWCGWCIKLQQNVFAKKEFVAWANKNVILLELDFPRRKQLSPELIQQNNSLQQVFNVAAFPVVWIFNTIRPDTTKKFNIDAFGSLGYPIGAEPGKEEIKFLEDATKILNNKTVK
jgi:thioredoxin-related protein